MQIRRAIPLFLGLGLTILSGALSGKDRVPHTAQRLTLAADTGMASVSGEVHGYGARDYVLSGKQGQTLELRLKSRNPYANFRIVSVNGRPDEKVMPAENRERTVVLPASGDYVVRVFMVRAGARRKGTFARFVLTARIH